MLKSLRYLSMLAAFAFAAPAMAADSGVIIPPGGTPASLSSASSNGAPVTGLVIKASKVSFYGAQVTPTTGLGYLMLFNATTRPADGAVAPLKCWYLPTTNLTFTISYTNPLSLSAGAYLAFSSTGCATLTTLPTAIISGDYQ